MSDPMSLPQFNRWIEGVKDVNKKGWAPEFSKIGAYLAKVHRDRLKRHVEPSGRPWPKTYSRPRPKVGDETRMFVRRRRIVVQRIRTTRGRKRAVRFREVVGPAFQPAPALIRTREVKGLHKTRTILDYLTGRGYVGRALHKARTEMSYGYPRGRKWIEDLQFGGTYKKTGKRVPPREIVGLNAADIREIEGILMVGFEKRVMRGA